MARARTARDQVEMAAHFNRLTVKQTERRRKARDRTAARTCTGWKERKAWRRGATCNNNNVVFGIDLPFLWKYYAPLPMTYQLVKGVEEGRPEQGDVLHQSVQSLFWVKGSETRLEAEDEKEDGRDGAKAVQVNFAVPPEVEEP